MVKRSCEEALAQVYLYLDGEVTWYRRALVRRHLKKCPPCDGKFAFEDRFKAVIRARAQEDPPPEIIDRLRTYIRSAGMEDPPTR